MWDDWQAGHRRTQEQHVLSLQGNGRENTHTHAHTHTPPDVSDTIMSRVRRCVEVVFSSRWVSMGFARFAGYGPLLEALILPAKADVFHWSTG